MNLKRLTERVLSAVVNTKPRSCFFFFLIRLCLNTVPANCTRQNTDASTHTEREKGLKKSHQTTTENKRRKKLLAFSVFSFFFNLLLRPCHSTLCVSAILLLLLLKAQAQLGLDFKTTAITYAHTHTHTHTLYDAGHQEGGKTGGAALRG